MDEVKTGIREFDDNFNELSRRLRRVEDFLGVQTDRVEIPEAARQAVPRVPRITDGKPGGIKEFQGMHFHPLSMRREAMLRRFVKERGGGIFRVNVAHDYCYTRAPHETPKTGAAFGLWMRSRTHMFEPVPGRRGYYRFIGDKG